MRNIWIMMAVLLLAVSAATASSAQAQYDLGGKDHLVFFLPSKESAVTKQIVDLWQKVGEKIGVPIEVMTSSDAPYENPTTDQIVEWAKELAKSKTIDITVLAPTGLFRIEEIGVKFIPIATYQIDKKKYDRACVLVRKDSPLLEIEGDDERVRALKGKNVSIGHGIRSNPVGDMLLVDHGINTPSHEFFNYVGGFGGIDDCITNTVAGEIDALITMKVDTKFSKEKQALMELAPLVCSDEYANMPMIVRDGLDFEMIKRIRNIILGIHKDKDFPQLGFLFAAIAGHFVPVSIEDYDNWRAIYEKGKKEGWLDDFGQAKYPRVEGEE